MNSPPSTDTATRILDAADALFCASGYDGVSMRDVALRAEVNKASVFYHFNSKDELFRSVLDRYYRAQRDTFDAAIARGGTLRERLHAVLDAYLDFFASHRRYPMLVQSLVNGRQEYLPFIQESFGPLFVLTVESLGAQTPERGPLSARHLYMTLSGAIINYFTYAPVLDGLWDRDPLSAEARAERREHLHWLVDTLLVALGVELDEAPAQSAPSGVSSSDEAG